MKTNDADQDVNEATAALKGMLGIGTPSKPVVVEEEEAAAAAAPKESTKKKKNRKKKGAKPPQGNVNSEAKGKKRQPKKKESENYAWSAFQSSPDASKLPLPEFSSPSVERKTVGGVSAEDIPAAVETEDGSHSDRAGTESPQAVKDPEPPVSKTGINLAAALASKPPEPSLPTPPPVPHFPGGSSPYHHHHHQQQQPNFTPQYAPPPPPPGYVTIQVQVPPMLMPGRQMMVTSPAGYPVQVVVPDGVPPGMIIPVHVPAAPMHMMPPPPQHYAPYYSPHR